MTDDQVIIDNIFKEIKSRSIIKFPEYEFPSIKDEELIEAKKSPKIFFTNDEYYDKDLQIIKFHTGQIFEGEMKNEEEKYYLENGIYKWPSGQIFQGKFEKNNFKEGILKYGDNIYVGKFDDGLFDGDGEFKFNKKDIVKGKFNKGEINGYAIVKKNNFEINGDFVESKAQGKIDKFYVNLEEHKYEFEKFNFRNKTIENEQLNFKKDGKKLLYIKNLNNLSKESNSKEIDIQNEELTILKDCLSLLDIKVPEFQNPTIPEEGLKVKKEDYPIIKFENGEEADIDEDKDENELKIPNGEKFIGRFDLEHFLMKEGKYFWPSGQVYEGKFNINSKFQTATENSKLSYKKKWKYKGKFKNGMFDDKGEIEYENGKFLAAYFKNNKIMGHTLIKYKNIEIEADVKNLLIAGIKINVDGHSYKIKEINLNIKKFEPIVITKEANENESLYFILNYRNNNDKIEIEKINKITNEELRKVLNILDEKIIFPSFELPSINENSLTIKQNENIISFQKGISYNKETETLSLSNNENYIGNLDNISSKFYLSKGEYSWPSGQKYFGKFNKDNIFNTEGEKSILIINDFTYEGPFDNGLPHGEGEMKWNNGDYIKGKFVNGKFYGNTFLKKNKITFEGNYIYSIIDGYIKNIKIEDSEKQIENEQLNIIKGKINETEIKFNGKIIQLSEENRFLISEQDFQNVEFDGEDIVLLFKFISKIRKFNLPTYEKPRISEDGIYVQNTNNLKNVQLAFPNNETFIGLVKGIAGNKYMLIEGEYNWPNGQSYKGKFDKNRFNDENGELNYDENRKYTGGFKNGFFEGKGEFKLKDDIIKGYFQKGQIKNDLYIKAKNFTFEGNNIDLINELYIKSFEIKTKDHFYEISDFNINNTNITYKRDEIEFKVGLSKELKQQIIESLLIRNKTVTKNFYYNNSFIGDLSNENLIKTLKIENNIYSGKLTKLTIYKNRLLDENKNKKNVDGPKIFKRIGTKEVDLRLNSMKSLREKLRNNLKVKQPTQYIYFGDIEKKEIAKIFNRKMLKEMEKENDLLKQDIITLKMEKELIEKERYNRINEIQDLSLYFDLIDNNYNDLIKEKDKIEEETNQIQKEIKQLFKENDFLSKYLKSKSQINNHEVIDKNIKEFENNNCRILNEISEKQKIINEQNREKDELLKKIKDLQINKSNIK